MWTTVSSWVDAALAFLVLPQKPSGRVPDAEVRLVDGTRVGVVRDENGTEHRVAATCTHRDWPLDFDLTSRTWKCARHGAEFDVRGAVLCGPARTPLARVHQESPDRGDGASAQTPSQKI